MDDPRSWFYQYMAASEIAGLVIGECVASSHSKYSCDYVLGVLKWPIM